MRALGIDLGSRRIGLALSDRSGTIASPHSVLQRGSSHRHDHQEIRRLVAAEEVEVVVIGLPIGLDGTEGPAALAARAEAAEIGTVIDVPVELFDERLTTVAADRILREGDLGASERRRVVDKVAAAVMLQSWLESRR